MIIDEKENIIERVNTRREYMFCVTNKNNIRDLVITMARAPLASRLEEKEKQEKENSCEVLSKC